MSKQAPVPPQLATVQRPPPVTVQLVLQLSLAGPRAQGHRARNPTALILMTAAATAASTAAVGVMGLALEEGEGGLPLRLQGRRIM